MSPLKVFAFATKGSDTNDELRLLTLLKPFKPEAIKFDYQSKIKSGLGLVQQATQQKPDLIVMEGTGLAGGLACLYLRIFHHIPYVFSSGDAVAPFIGLNWPLLAPLFSLYERLLYSFCLGFIGWTPYLVGRSLTMGASRGMTAAGWVHVSRTPVELQQRRAQIRHQLGIPDNAIVFGLLGSLVWNPRRQYCYGYELIKAMQTIKRDDVYVLVVGDGSGLEHLKELAGSQLGRQIVLTGNVPLEQVLDYMAVMDVASLPQSVDGVGNFRYTTKVCEYLAAGLPIVLNQTPMAYDLVEDCSWRLPGQCPWSPSYLDALANLMTQVTPKDIQTKQQGIPAYFKEFDCETQIRRTTGFVQDLLFEKSAEVAQLTEAIGKREHELI
jgi:hypothetical protein